jgi:hypothetical protein
MSIQTRSHSPGPVAPAPQRGAALVVGLILLLVLTLLAISGMTTAALELQMASNEQYQERAFQFADSGIEQAIDAGVYNTNVTIGNYDDLSALDPAPVRGTGQQIANCPEVAGAEDAQQCEYFMREDRPSNLAATSVCGGQGYSFGTGFQDYYFVVDSYGVSERGALSEHRQSFCVIGPGGT